LIFKILQLKRWKDEGIRWNPSEYKGIIELRLPVEKIWNPGK